MYDIASLTKVGATTTLVAKLAEGGFPVPLDLDARVERYLPEWASGPQPEWRHQVTVRHLLTHTSGLPAFKEYWRTSKNKQDTLAKIFAEPLEYEPATKEIYSDLGIILTPQIIQRPTAPTPPPLGWAGPTEGRLIGHYFSPHRFGQPGFTGPSIWIDPDRQLFVALLTNRVHPTRENQKIAQLRPAFHDAVMQALGFATAAAPAK